MSAESLTKTYRAFKSAASSLLARFGIDVGKKDRHGAGFTAIENLLFDEMKSNDKYISYNRRHITFIMLNILSFFRTTESDDAAFIKAHKKDPERYFLKEEDFINPFKQIKFSREEETAIKEILHADLPIEVKLSELRGQQADKLYRFLYETFLTEEGKKRIMSKATHEPTKTAGKILDYSALKSKKPNFG